MTDVTKGLTVILPLSYPSFHEDIMLTTKLSSKGQIIIPQPVRASHNWKPGMTFTVIDTKEGLLLKPKTPFAHATLSDVAGCLKYVGRAKTLEEMDAAIAKGIKAST